LVSWNCKFNLKVLPSYYYFLFYQHWQLLLKWTDSLIYNSKTNLAEMFSMRSYTRVVTFVQIRQKTWPPCDFENSDWSIFKKILLRNRWRDWIEIWYICSYECLLHVVLLFAPFENSKWPPAEVKVCTETLWETTCSSSSWEQPNII
jgi:hypothetical protein